MLSPITCTMPDDPGLTFSTRNALPPFSTTEPATAASMTKLLVMLSSALRLYVPGARTMRPTAVLARALVRPTTLLTAVPGGYASGGGYGGGGGEGGGGEGEGGGGEGEGGGGSGAPPGGYGRNDGGEGGEGGGGGSGGGAGQVETVP
eukprot:jgi/Chrpa1/21038/Chrysochromulina_OHIO_Genome00025043-RA